MSPSPLSGNEAEWAARDATDRARMADEQFPEGDPLFIVTELRDTFHKVGRWEVENSYEAVQVAHWANGEQRDLSLPHPEWAHLYRGFAPKTEDGLTRLAAAEKAKGAAADHAMHNMEPLERESSKEWAA